MLMTERSLINTNGSITASNDAKLFFKRARSDFNRTKGNVSRNNCLHMRNDYNKIRKIAKYKQSK